jgi:hypothetical protein
MELLKNGGNLMNSIKKILCMTMIILATMVGSEKTVNSIDTLCNFGGWLTGGYNEDLSSIGCLASSIVLTTIPVGCYKYLTTWKSDHTDVPCKIFPVQGENIAQCCMISPTEQYVFLATLCCLPYASHCGCAFIRKCASKLFDWTYRLITWT